MRRPVTAMGSDFISPCVLLLLLHNQRSAQHAIFCTASIATINRLMVLAAQVRGVARAPMANEWFMLRHLNPF